MEATSELGSEGWIEVFWLIIQKVHKSIRAGKLHVKKAQRHEEQQRFNAWSREDIRDWGGEGSEVERLKCHVKRKRGPSSHRPEEVFQTSRASHTKYIDKHMHTSLTIFLMYF